MAALVHFSKTDNTVRTTTSTTQAELTNYTISWSDLTTAGFAAGDNVVILVAVKTWNSSANIGTTFIVEHGTTFAGRTTYDPGAEQRAEPISTSAGDQFLWVGTATLVDSENIYFGGSTTTSATASYQEFVCEILNLDDLSANDWFYASNTLTTATDAYDTSGAGTTIPATGDWLLIAATRFNVNNTTTDMLVAIHDGTSDISEVRTQAENVNDRRVITTMAAKALSSGTTVRTRFRTATSGAHAPTHSLIFGLRLDAFQDHWIAQTTNTITHSVLDTYQEFAGNGTYSKGTTGPFVVMGWPIHNIAETAKRPYGRIQIGGSDWPAANANRQAVADNGTASKIAPFLYGYAASQGSGTLDIDLDCAEDGDITPNPTCTEQVAVAFSLELASGVVDAALTPPVGAVSATGLAPTIWAGAGLTPPVGGIGTLGHAPTVVASVSLTPAVGAVATAGAAPTISVGSALAPAVGAVATTGRAPTASTGAGLAPAVGVIAVTGYAPTFVADYDAEPAEGVVATIGDAPTVIAGASLAPEAGSVATAGQDPTFAADHDAAPEVGSVATAGAAPTISIGFDLTPAVGAVAVLGQAPSFAAAGDFAATPAIGIVGVAGQTPTFAANHTAQPLRGTVLVEQAPRFQPAAKAGATLAPTTGTVAVLGHAPSVAIGGNVASAPVTGAVATAGSAPTISASAVLTPAVGSIATAGSAPTFTAHYTAAPAVGTVAVAGAAPVLAAGFVASPAAGAVAVLGLAPSFAAAGDVAAVPPTGVVSTTGSAPVIGLSVNLTPTTGTVATVGAAPGFTGHVAVAPTAGSVAAQGHAPLFVSANNITAEPPAGAVAVQGYAPIVNVTGAVDAFPATGAVGIVGKIPTVNTSVNLVPITGAVAAVGHAPEWAPGINLDLLPAVGAVGVVGFAPVYRVPTISAKVRDRGPSAGARDRGATANILDEAA